MASAGDGGFAAQKSFARQRLKAIAAQPRERESQFFSFLLKAELDLVRKLALPMAPLTLAGMALALAVSVNTVEE